MANIARIRIWNRYIGAIVWDETSGVGSFEFETSYFKYNWDLAPLMMPLTEAKGLIFSFPGLRNSMTFKGLPGLLADVLPDKYGNALIDAWLSRNGRPPGSMNPVETLCFIGNRGIGALEFVPPEPRGTNASTKIEIESLVQIANDILTGRRNFSADLSKEKGKALLDILKIGTSAGGARAKAVIAYNEKTEEIRSGQTEAPPDFTHWLIKFDGVADSMFGITNGYGRVEMAYYLMAQDAEIEMAECRLLEDNGRAHFMTRRFDRDPEKGKIHFQSFCALRHFDFNDITSFSYEQLFETMRMLGLPYPQAEQLYRRMVFNVLSRNCDDHTKNFGFIMDKTGMWKLSPAFDVCHAYRPSSPWVSRQSLSVNGKRQNITRDDLLTVAGQMNIKKAPAIVDQIHRIVRNWRNYANRVNVNEKLARAIQDTFPNID